MKTSIQYMSATTGGLTVPTDPQTAVTGYERNGSTHTALVNLQAKPIETTVAAKPVITSSSQTTSQGVRRIMLKFELDYNARGYDAAVQAGNFYDPARSGRKVSAHVVFTIPKGMAEDMLGQNGADVAEVALGQADYLRVLLLAALLDDKAYLAAYSGTVNSKIPFKTGVLSGLVDDSAEETSNVVTARVWSNSVDDFLRRGVAGLTPLDPTKDLKISQISLVAHA